MSSFRKLRQAFGCGARAIFLSAIALLAGFSARAEPLAYNPHPTSDDILLPMPGDYKMVFVRVPVPGSGYWGSADRVFDMGGDPKKPQPFEVSRSVRIGGNFKTASGKWYLAFGKYEVTIGQYAALLGDGDIAKGLAALAEVSDIDELKTDREKVAGNPRWLARPLHGLSLHDYHDFIARYNTWCLGNVSCVGVMKTELGIAGFLRLPTELEWEYVARGGEAGMREASPLPFPLNDSARFAHLDNPRKALPDEIGKRSPLPTLPIYDIYGNVAELMANPFTMDNGFGSVGAGVIRGGDYRTPATQLRYSYREELAFFRLNSTDNTYVKVRNRLVGIRLMVGAVIKDIEDRGVKQKEMEQEFRCCYLPIMNRGGSGGKQPHIAGRTLATAKDLGALAPNREVEFSDRIDVEQATGFITFRLEQYGRLRVELGPATADVIMEVKHGTWESSREFEALAGKIRPWLWERALPGPIWIRFFSPKVAQIANYRARIFFEPIDIAGNIPAQAHDLGILTGSQLTLRDYVGPGDAVDYYKFRTDRVDSISMRLLDLTGDANLELLNEDQVKLAESVNPRTVHEEIDYPNAKPGTYFVRVYSKGNNPATYTLMLALGAVDTAGESIATARDLGTWQSDTVSIREHLSSTDMADFFKITLSQTSQVKVQVSQMTADVDLYFHDSAGKVIGRSTKKGTEAESYDTAREPGIYYVSVRNATQASTAYFLTIDVRPVAPYCHAQLAYSMNVQSSPNYFTSSVGDDCGNRWVTFAIDAKSTARLDLELLDADAKTAVSIWMIRIGAADGTKPFEMYQVGSGHRTAANMLEPGTYFTRITRMRGASASLRFSVTISSGLFDPQMPGTIIGEHDDWLVAVDTSNNRKYCWAYTFAKLVSPDGWRAERPVVWLSLQPKITNSVAHGFDQARFYDRTARLQASVKTRGSTLSIPVSVESAEATQVQTMEACNVSKTGRCISIKGLQGLTKGQDLVLEGTSASGQRSSVTFSLRGYQSAIRQAATLCDNSGIIRNLVKD